MQILVRVDQRRAIREGVDAPSSTAHIEVDPAQLTPAQREVLADFAREGHDATQEIATWRHGYSRRDRISVTRPTSEALIAELDRIATERAAWIEEIEAREAERQARIDREAREALEAVAGQTEEIEIWIDEWGYISSHGVISRKVIAPKLPSCWPGKASPELEAQRREIEAEREAAIKAAKEAALPELRAKLEAYEAEREAARQAAIDALRAWALEHGSQRLRLLIEEDMDWQAVAEDEYIYAHTPEGFGPLDDVCHDEVIELAPAERTILALREIRKLVEKSDALSDPEIVRIVEHCPASEGELDDPNFEYEAIRLVVSSPLGKSREVYYWV